MLLVRMAAVPGVACFAVGSVDYKVSAWRYPSASEYTSLGVRSVDISQAEIDCGYTIGLLHDFGSAVEYEIGRLQPDLVWSQLEGALAVLKSANRHGVRGLYFVHDAEFDAAEMREIASLDCHLVTSSRFLAEKVFKATGRWPHVIYPPPELYSDTNADPSGLITMINPHRVKGLETFLAVAKRLPNVNFLLQESWKLGDTALDDLKRRLTGLRNVEFAHRVSDMREVYRRTRLLIVPSRWEEGFGMVALEAQSCGIPVIASRRGGLPEAVGDGGLLIDDYLNPDAWAAAIEGVLNDSERYREWSERARRHAASDAFSADVLARRLYAIALSEPQRPGRWARGVFEVRRRAEPIVRRWLRR
jgi:glycosyltransferase involved in cell wall biosynthesis